MAARALAQMALRGRTRVARHGRSTLRHANTILQAQWQDVEKATTDQLSLPIIDRLKSMKTHSGDGGRHSSGRWLEDPVGKVIAEWIRPMACNFKVRVPLGYRNHYESRPECHERRCGAVTKKGNAVILRGGSNGSLQTSPCEALRAGAVSPGCPNSI